MSNEWKPVRSSDHEWNDQQPLLIAHRSLLIAHCSLLNQSPSRSCSAARLKPFDRIVVAMAGSRSAGFDWFR